MEEVTCCQEADKAESRCHRGRCSKSLFVTRGLLLLVAIVSLLDNTHVVGQAVSITSQRDAVSYLISLAQSCTNDTGAATVCQPFPPFNVLRAPLSVVTSSSVCQDDIICILSAANDGSLDCSNCSSEFTADKLNDGLTTDSSRWQSAVLNSTDVPMENPTLEVAFNLPAMVVLDLAIDQPSASFLRVRSMDIELSSDGGQTWRQGGFFRSNCSAEPDLQPCSETGGPSLQLQLTSTIDLARAFVNETLMEQLTSSFATNIRIVLLELAAPSVAGQSQFFSFTEILVVAAPFCNGRSRRFDRANDTQPCDCEHGTGGPTCNLCFNLPYPPATAEEALECDMPPTTEMVLTTQGAQPNATTAPSDIPSTSEMVPTTQVAQPNATTAPSAPTPSESKSSGLDTNIIIIIAAGGGVALILILIIIILLVKRRSNQASRKEAIETIQIYDVSGSRTLSLPRARPRKDSDPNMILVHDSRGTRKVTLKRNFVAFDNDSMDMTSNDTTNSLGMTDIALDTENSGPLGNSNEVHSNPSAL